MHLLALSPRRWISVRWIGQIAGLVMLLAPAIVVAEMLVTERIDGSPVNVIVERPEHGIDIPIVLFIDGSGLPEREAEGISGLLSSA